MPDVRAAEALEKLRADDTQLYRAAFPGYPSNFTRDSITYGLLAGDSEALRAQLAFCAKHQGIHSDPETGEEEGKMHHELPGERMNGLLTTYNGCDTAALWLLALAALVDRGEPELLTQYAREISRAVGYIRSHVMDGIFYEDSAQCGAPRFALDVTYWKDSHLNSKSPTNYPITFALAHFQNAHALRTLARVNGDTELASLGIQMVVAGLELFWSHDHFVVAMGSAGTPIDSPSSDSLHCLLYLDPSDIPAEFVAAIVANSHQLETPHGYRTALPVVKAEDEYHTRYVWVHEQALLHAAGSRHGLHHVQEVASRVRSTLGKSFPELIDPLNDYTPAGNSLQLWSIGAYLYFQDPTSSYLLDTVATEAAA